MRQLFDFIEGNNFPGIVYGDIAHLDHEGNAVKHKSLDPKYFTKNLLQNNFLACGSVFLKRELAHQFLFQEDRKLSSAEDWELWLRVHAHYSFTHFPFCIFKQVHHNNRSLQTISPDKIEIRDNFFASLVKTNLLLRSKYGVHAMNLFIADRYTFIALSWCGQDWKKVYRYWFKAIRSSPAVIRRKRFWAILKKIVLR